MKNPHATHTDRMPSDTLDTHDAPFDRDPFRLGPWNVTPRELRLDPAESRLHGNGDRTAHDDAGRVRLPHKEMLLLLTLADGDGRPLDTERIRHAVWGDQAITDGVVKNLVWNLRRSLGESAERPGMVETVPGAGYRLAETPQEIPQRVATERTIADLDDSEFRPGPARPTTVTALAAAALLVVALAGYRTASSNADAGPSSHVESVGPPRLLVDLPGRESEIALDAAGRHLLFSRKGENGTGNLFVLDLDDPTESPLQLTNSAEGWDMSGAWSADGNRIAFVRRQTGTLDYEVRVMSAAGGESQVVARFQSIYPVDLAWRDGDSLFVSSVPTTEDYEVGALGLAVLHLADGRLEELTKTEPRSGRHRAPAPSHDGRSLAFIQRKSASAQVLRLDLDTGEIKELTRSMPGIVQLAWTPDDRHVLFTGTDDSTWTLWSVPADGSAPPSPYAPTAGAMDVGEVAVSATGILVYEQSQLHIGTLRFDGLRRSLDGTIQWDSGPERVVPSDRVDAAAAPDPTGRRLAYLSDRTGRVALWLAELPPGGLRTSGLDGASPEATEREPRPPRKLPVDGVSWHSRPRWSPDGTSLAFSVRRGDQFDVAVMRLDDDGTRPLRVDLVTDTPEFRELLPTWRNDGLAIRYTRRPMAGGPPTLCEQDLWRDDGPRELAERVLSVQDLPDGRVVVARPDGSLELLRREQLGIEPGPGSGGPNADESDGEEDVWKLPVDLGPGDWGNWQATPDGVYWVRSRDTTVRYYDFPTATTSVVVELDHPAAQAALRLSHDGKSLYVASVLGNESRLLVLRP